MEGKWWHKISGPLSALLMPLLGSVAAFGLARSGHLLVRAVIGMALGFAYFVVDNAALAMGNFGGYPPLIAAWAPFMLFDGLQLVFTYALRSLGDQVIAGLNSIVAFFIVTIALGSWLISSGIGALALVWCIGISMLVCALLQGGRLVWFSSPLRLKSSD